MQGKKNKCFKTRRHKKLQEIVKPKAKFLLSRALCDYIFYESIILKDFRIYIEQKSYFMEEDAIVYNYVSNYYIIFNVINIKH